jgi:hypothetical protein
LVLMMDIFANTACKISATASSSSQRGCFRDRSKSSLPCTLVTRGTDGERQERPHDISSFLQESILALRGPLRKSEFAYSRPSKLFPKGIPNGTIPSA